jgi:hypothetical protein
VVVLASAGAVAQTAAPVPGTEFSIPTGYTAHHSIDLGGRINNTNGSPAMYDTLVNEHSGPRILGETLELRALPNSEKPQLVDSLKAFGSGFGGDPYNFAKVDAYKGKAWEFSGLFRRDRQYFDYNLLGNPNIVPGTMPIGSSSAPSGSIPWGRVNHSSRMYNTVRRMTDTNVTLFPLSTFTFRAGYSQNVLQGTSLIPAYTIMKYDALLQQNQRNSNDDFMAAIDWKPIRGTRVTFEEQIDHWKGNSSVALDPNGFMAQEADGTKVYLGNWDNQTPYASSACTAGAMGGGTVFSAPKTSGGLPIINPACSVVTSYLRSQPTRVLIPTEMLRFQSSSVKNITMNGDVRYTRANMNMPNYYESVQGLEAMSGTTPAITSILYNGGHASAKRAVVSADYGIIWQATKAFTLEDSVNFSSAQQPGSSIIPIPATLQNGTGTANQTINYSGAQSSGNAQALPHGINGTLTANYFGQSFLTNNLTANWDLDPRTRLGLTYHYSDHKIGQGVPHGGEMQETDPVSGTVEIVENAGILNAAFRPTTNWEINGSVEIGYADNAFTSVSPRQSKQYRVHTMYKPKSWATISGAFNDRERHNNTSNNEEAAINYGPLQHEDHFRIAAVNATLAPNEHYGFDLGYTYTEVYSATNICFASGATATLPGAATLTGNGTPNVCPGVFARGSTTVLTDYFARDFQKAPTNFGSIGVHLSPVDKVQTGIGYRVSSVSGSRFFNDARDVNGSMNSVYQSPYVNFAYTMHPGFVWKAEYNFYGYGEGGPSGAPLCSIGANAVSTTATVVPCSNFSNTGMTEPTSGLTGARTFHANNVLLGFHYEF